MGRRASRVDGRGGPDRDRGPGDRERRDGLRAPAEDAGRDLETATAQGVLRGAHETFGVHVVIASPVADAVLAHLAATVAAGIEVLLPDTGHHFPQTLGTRDAVGQVCDVTVRAVLPVLAVGQREAAYGAGCSSAPRTPAVRSARSSRSPAGSRRTRPGRRAPAATRPTPAGTWAWSSRTPAGPR